MPLQHFSQEADTAGESAESAEGRLQQLEQAREADRVWRAERRAELERQLHRAACRTVAAALAAAVIAIPVVRFLLPASRRAEVEGVHLLKCLAGVFLPLVVGLLVLVVFGRSIGLLLAEKALYDREPEEPSAGE